MAGRQSVLGEFWVQIDRALAESHAERWDSVINRLETVRRSTQENPEHFRSTRMALQRLQADRLLALAYASSDRFHDAWRVLHDQPVDDLLDPRLPVVNHADAEFEGLGDLFSLLMQALGGENSADPGAAPLDPIRAGGEPAPGAGLLRILIGDRTMILLLRTVGDDGRPETSGMRYAVAADEIVAALAALAARPRPTPRTTCGRWTSPWPAPGSPRRRWRRDSPGSRPIFGSRSGRRCRAGNSTRSDSATTGG